jgi:hypothetical protein
MLLGTKFVPKFGSGRCRRLGTHFFKIACQFSTTVKGAVFCATRHADEKASAVRCDFAARGDGPGRGYVLGEPSLRSVRRDNFSRNPFKDVSARSGTRTKRVTSYNVRYGVLPCFLTFCALLFPMHLYPWKTRVPPPQAWGRAQKTSSTSPPRGVSWFPRLWLVP